MIIHSRQYGCLTIKKIVDTEKVLLYVDGGDKQKLEETYQNRIKVFKSTEYPGCETDGVIVLCYSNNLKGNFGLLQEAMSRARMFLGIVTCLPSEDDIVKHLR